MLHRVKKNLSTGLCRRIKTDRHLQIAIALEINVAVITVYQWAAYHPQRLASNRAAMRIVKKYVKANP